MSEISREAQAVLDFWYDPEKTKKDQAKLWFGGQENDEIIRGKFGDLVEKARNGELSSWENDPKSALAHILLIDQFCRSIFRGTAKSFDCDCISLDIAKKLVSNGKYKELNACERFFVYLPLEHSENIDDQNMAVKLYEELAVDYQGTEHELMAKNGIAYAKKHREVIEKYGRFPKRNAAIGRKNTQQEEELLKNYPYSF